MGSFVWDAPASGDLCGRMPRNGLFGTHRPVRTKRQNPCRDCAPILTGPRPFGSALAPAERTSTTTCVAASTSSTRRSARRSAVPLVRPSLSPSPSSAEPGLDHAPTLPPPPALIPALIRAPVLVRAPVFIRALSPSSSAPSRLQAGTRAAPRSSRRSCARGRGRTCSPTPCRRRWSPRPRAPSTSS